MRKGESEQVIEVFGKELDANLIYNDATDRFLDKLAGVAEPEKKLSQNDLPLVCYVSIYSLLESFNL